MYSYITVTVNQLPATQTRGHNFELYKIDYTCRSKAVFFSQRVINVWNQLPKTTDCSSLSYRPLYVVSIAGPDLAGGRPGAQLKLGLTKTVINNVR